MDILVAIRRVEVQLNTPNYQGSSGPNTPPLSERILWYWCDWKVEFGEAWSGGSGNHLLGAGRGKSGRKRGGVSASIARVFKQRQGP